MANTKKWTKKWPERLGDYQHLPKNAQPVMRESGCKVGWWLFDDRVKAETAAKIADHNANIDEYLGYDFGYCCPGSIETVERDGRTLFRVCHS